MSMPNSEFFHVVHIDKNFLKKYHFKSADFGNQKTIASTYIILTLFAISIFGFFAINPTLTTISNLQKQYEDNKTVDDALARKLAGLFMLNTQYQTYSSLFDQMYSAIPETPKTAYVTREMETLARNRNLTLSDLDVGSVQLYPAPKKTDTVYSYTVNISYSQTDENFISFLEDVVNFDRIISIDAFNFTKNSSTTDQTEAYTVSLTGRAYFNKK